MTVSGEQHAWGIHEDTPAPQPHHNTLQICHLSVTSTSSAGVSCHSPCSWSVGSLLLMLGLGNWLVVCYTLEGKQAQHRQLQPAQRDIPVGKILLEQHTGSEKRILPGFIICPGKRSELGQNSECPLLWSLPQFITVSSAVMLDELRGCPCAGCDLCWVPGHMTDLVLSLRRDSSARGTSCCLESEMAQSALPEKSSSTSASPSASGAACHKLKRRQGEGILILHLLVFIFWLLVVAVFSFNLF